MADSAGSDDLVDALTELVSYANYHFAYEEKLLAEHDYADLGEQVAEHTDFARVMANACYDAMHAQADRARLLEYLNGWWFDHILKIDMKYKAFFQANWAASPVDCVG